MTGNPRCQNPDFLRQIPLQDVAFPDFRCEEGKPRAPGREGGGGLVSPGEEVSHAGGRGEALVRGWGGEQGDPLFVLHLPLPGGSFV